MKYVRDKQFGQVKNAVNHGFFGRLGGVSTGGFATLNCGLGTSDLSESVQKNRKIVANEIGAPVENMVTIRQVHSAKCVIVTDPFAPDMRPEADAMVTDKAGMALGILTADCGAVLFYGEKSDASPVIGAAHSGWRGALDGVNEATIAQMVALGAQKDSIRAVIGPCIAQASYEVGADFVTPFITRQPQDEHFFKNAQKAEHLMFDLPGYIASRLAAAGINRVVITGHDTYKDKDEAGEYLFFSHRRATHEGYADENGRQISVIVIV